MALKKIFNNLILPMIILLTLYNKVSCYTKRTSNPYSKETGKQKKSIYNVSHKDGYDAKILTVGEASKDKSNYY